MFCYVVNICSFIIMDEDEEVDVNDIEPLRNDEL